AYRVQVASYQVRRGDTMAALARRYGVSVKEIARLNRMSSRGELRKGQTVRVPQAVRASIRSSRGSRVGRDSRVGRGHVMRYSERPVIRSRQSSGKDKGRSVSSRSRSS